MLNSKNKHNFLIPGFFIAFFCLGLWIFIDYGVSADEMTQRSIGMTSLAFVANFIPIPFLLRGTQPVSDPQSFFLLQKDRDYGVAFELPAEILIDILRLSDDAEIYYFKHLLTFLVFFTSVIFFFKTISKRYGSWQIGLLGTLLLILSPRIFGESFFNNKDLVFMSFFTIATFSLVQFITKPTLLNGLYHALACAIAIDTRIMGVILPVITIVALLILIIKRKYSISNTGIPLLGYGSLLVVFTITFWPWLWLDPLGNFQTAFHNMAKFRHVVSMIFMGGTVTGDALPWYYIPVWIGITTPLLYSLLFLVGVPASLYVIVFNAKVKISDEDRLQDAIFLCLFFIPLIAVISLHSVLYNGWRQMYFIYPAFILITIRGLFFLWQCYQNLRSTRLIISAALIISILSTTYWMVRWHPHQFLYFNPLAGEWSTRYDVDYWGSAYRQPIQKIIAQDTNKTYSIYDGLNDPNSVNNWGSWQLDHLRAVMIFPQADRNRIVSDLSENCSDYIITTTVGNRKQYLNKSEFDLFDDLKIDKQIVYSTFKRKVRIFDEFSPELNKKIEFNDPHVRCFLKSGWGDNVEAWGVWSTGKEAEIDLLMPPERPKELILNIRAFVAKQWPTQDVEISLNGQWVKKVKLSQFETNEVTIPLPPDIPNSKWLKITLKLPTATSPKSLGMGEDNRMLGIGLKSAVFR